MAYFGNPSFSGYGGFGGGYGGFGFPSYSPFGNPYGTSFGFGGYAQPVGPRIKMTYFDIKGRAEPTRLALYIAGVQFEDERISFDQFKERKETFPFGQLPVLEVDGKALCQSWAQLRFAGRVGGLYPEDSWAAAKVDEVLYGVEDGNQAVSKTLFIQDADEKTAARKKLAEEFLPGFLSKLEKLLSSNGNGTWFVGPNLTVADLAVYNFCNWINGGILDGIPKEILDKTPQLKAHNQRVGSIPRIAEWNTKIEAAKKEKEAAKKAEEEKKTASS